MPGTVPDSAHSLHGGDPGHAHHHTSYHVFKTKKRQEIIDITDLVEERRATAGIAEGFVLVSAMHISASVFVNDHESGLGWPRPKGVLFKAVGA